MSPHQIGIKAHCLMADHKLKGVLGAKDKSSNHGSSSSKSTKEKHIIDLEILAQHLQQRLRLYEDRMSMENLMVGICEYKIKKARGIYARDYDYHGRYDGYYPK